MQSSRGHVLAGLALLSNQVHPFWYPLHPFLLLYAEPLLVVRVCFVSDTSFEDDVVLFR